jgi:hypothetical protein
MRSSWALACALLACCSSVGHALAQSGPSSPSSAASPLRGGVLVVRFGARGTLDESAIRAAVARELGVRVAGDASADPSAPVLELSLRDDGRTLDATYQAMQRSVRLPEQADAAVETIALLAGNLVRNEAAELLAELERSRADTEAPAAEPAATEPPAPSSPPAPASRPKPETPAKPRQAIAPTSNRDLPKRPVNATLFHPIALEPDSEKYSFAFELGLFYARLGRIEGAALDVFVQRIDHGLNGAALSGLWSDVRGNVNGAVLSSLVATGAGKLEGAQLATAFAWQRGSLAGVQLSAGVAAADQVSGVQASSASVSTGALRGAQLGVVDVAAKLEGLQLGVATVAEELNGVQLGVVNVAGHVRGAQVGLVNIASGVDGEQAGIVSVSHDTRIRATSWVDVTTSGDATLHGGIKFQGRHVYSVLGLGSVLGPDPEHRYRSTVALGARLGTEPVFAQADVGALTSYASDFRGTAPVALQYRLMAGVAPVPWAALFVGAGLHHELAPDQAPVEASGIAGFELF